MQFNSRSKVISSFQNKETSKENEVNASLLDMKSFINLEDGSNLTEISPILTCIHTLNESNALWDVDHSKHFKSLSLQQIKNETAISKEDGFCFVVSLRDGSCIYSSDAITYHLGYPKDMLVGQCFMNFLFHKDHITFANHLTQGLNACFIQGKRNDSYLVLNTFFCRLRLYQGLKHGFSVSDRKMIYRPFKITLHINELIVDDMCVEKASGTLCVKATATHVSSVYTAPNEIPAMTSFSTRHTASCHFSHVDASAIPYLGYLPQDMIGFSVFDFYHVDDLLQLKDIYELVIKEHGSSFRSKPYRFKAQNGCYLMLETEWSCFINPWSHKLEFVVGQHRVLQGPSDIDIFTPCQTQEMVLPEEILKECQSIQREIKTLLSESIQKFEAKKGKRYCNKRKRDLATFVNKCIDGSFADPNQKENAEKQLDLLEERNNSDQDSVVMGDISPYQEINDSSVTSETPPSVQQLRYQENIERFFASQPKTYSDESEEYKNEKLMSVEDSQGSSNVSGNGSGNDSKGLQSLQNENNQKSGSNSSKCNMSSFTAGDSGYGKSLGKETNDPNVSQASSSNQVWPTNSPNNSGNTNEEKFSSCLALTEEYLCVHNRMNHKHFKQQRKTKSGMNTTSFKDNNWFQQKDLSLTKHKKNARTQTLNTPALAQKEDAVKTATPEQLNSDLKTAVPNLSESSVPSAYATNPFMYSGSCAPTPTPFYIPVMYMGSMPFFPNAQPQWPFGPVPAPPSSSSKPEANVGYFQVPGFPQGMFPKFNANENFNQTSKGQTSCILTTTTTTMPVQTMPTHKHAAIKSKNYAGRKGISADNMKDVKSDPDDCHMQESQSSFTHSSSCQSADKDEEMELGSKRRCASAHSDKIELTSELAYRYQMNVLNLDDVLKKDREVLKSMPQPELVNQQLQMLQGEREAENESKLKVDENDFCMTEEVMLGLATEDEVNEELEYREESLLQLMCEDS
ncbi:period circadian protein [Trichonephila inaurata madagascariensis]|uniref:Period circadian protein n=1 Tax=Trichonephila inaurata madagascariensis TaxID=2747483 RepID=A0A8X7CK50_9ARAC|nr:period circadian protein [Trichonephila inaurata madagascariensis]